MRHAPIDEALQMLVPQSLRQQSLNTLHHAPLSGRSKQHCMYDTMRRDYYWPNMARNL